MGIQCYKARHSLAFLLPVFWAICVQNDQWWLYLSQVGAA
jgi:hypothetical protein